MKLPEIKVVKKVKDELEVRDITMAAIGGAVGALVGGCVVGVLVARSMRDDISELEALGDELSKAVDRAAEHGEHIGFGKGCAFMADIFKEE